MSGRTIPGLLTEEALKRRLRLDWRQADRARRLDLLTPDFIAGKLRLFHPARVPELRALTKPLKRTSL